MTLSTEKKDNLFNRISRSHLYWGRKPTSGLFKVLESIKPGDIFLDPFCGGGTPAIAALSRGARVIASDLNPMAVFLSKVIIQPISVLALKEAFESVRVDVADSILQNYTIFCPRCQERLSFDYLKWNNQDGEVIPEAVKIRCDHCGSNELIPLSKNEISMQLQSATRQPQFWFPQDPIRSQRKTGVEFFHELFTGRNLTSLAQLYHAIDKISLVRCRETMQYVFTAMLYNCSSMQAFSERRPCSSPGWTAPGFYLPRLSQEKNVWNAFENRFKAVLESKQIVNSLLCSVRFSTSLKEFENSSDDIYLYQVDSSRFLFPGKSDIAHIFLDPPIDDIDYPGLSEFWGSWLCMDSDIQDTWNPGAVSVEDNGERLLKLLIRIRENTGSSCLITLACRSNGSPAWESMRESISEAGYNILLRTPILWSSSQRRRKESSTDLYLSLQRSSKKGKSIDYEPSDKDFIDLKFYSRVACFLNPDISRPERIKEKAGNLLERELRMLLREVKESEIKDWVSDEELNRKAYNRLCLIFIELLLAQDGFRIISADTSQFDEADLKIHDELEHLPMPQGLANGADFVAENYDGNKIFFCFYDKRGEDALKQICRRVFDYDNDERSTICYLVIPSHKEMTKCRQVDWADNWPQGFFISFNNLLEKATEIDGNRFGHLTAITQETYFDLKPQRIVEHFRAEVSENTPIGGGEDPSHFLIRFRAPHLRDALPGQFVMIDTLQYGTRKKTETPRPARFLAPPGGYSSFVDSIPLKPSSFLKRPFSIHRAYYKHFKEGYTTLTHLPPVLATITHTVFPHQFDILYKVIEDGTGTNELRHMKRGDKLQTLGPLGKKTDVSKWRSDGIEEVHLIGGGVGMAPLIFFGQSLNFYSFKIKAFIGIDRLDTLMYKDKVPFSASFAEYNPRKAYVYIDNLKSIGLRYDDIHVSFEKKTAGIDLDRRLPEANYFHGLVSEYYKLFLNKLNDAGSVLVLACGPEPMLKALMGITFQAGIRMKVLLEKRMGCGIGVCMSCVCRTKKDNIEQYSRVCTEGPLFDVEDIVWD